MNVPAKRVLLLSTEMYSTGGIQRFNRTFLSACARLHVQCRVLSLCDLPEAIAREPSLASIQIEGFSGSRIAFTMAVARTLLRERFDATVIGHLNFVDMAVALSLVIPGRAGSLLLIAHGIEVWNGIHPGLRLALKRVSQVLCVSRYTKQRMEEQNPGISPHRFSVFPNALSKEWVESANRLRRDLRTAGSQNYILSVTRLDPGDRYKGIITVLEAFSMLRDKSLRYLIVGTGNDEPFLNQTAKRLGVADRVDFLGRLPDEELVDLYRECRAFVLPSGKEGFGIVFLEAMFFGAPVIAAHEKGARDVVIDGETGLTIQYGDVVALRAVLERILADRTLAEDLRARGRQCVTGTGSFTFDQFVARCALALKLST